METSKNTELKGRILGLCKAVEGISRMLVLAGDKTCGGDFEGAEQTLNSIPVRLDFNPGPASIEDVAKDYCAAMSTMIACMREARRLILAGDPDGALCFLDPTLEIYAEFNGEHVIN